MGYKTITHQQLEEIKAVVNLERGQESRLLLSDDPILRLFQAFYDGNHHN